jgi:lipid II:glycine glycyltransferase (peptidoglycan interpeptide bridge formation enzyme)
MKFYNYLKKCMNLFYFTVEYSNFLKKHCNLFVKIEPILGYNYDNYDYNLIKANTKMKDLSNLICLFKIHGCLCFMVSFFLIL